MNARPLFGFLLLVAALVGGIDVPLESAAGPVAVRPSPAGVTPMLVGAASRVLAVRRLAGDMGRVHALEAEESPAH